MSVAVLLQDPAETATYPLDWSAFLSLGDTIAASSWSISPDGPTLSGDAFADTSTTVTVCGVTFGTIYRLTNTVDTAGGDSRNRSLTIRGFLE